MVALVSSASPGTPLAPLSYFTRKQIAAVESLVEEVILAFPERFKSESNKAFYLMRCISWITDLSMINTLVEGGDRFCIHRVEIASQHLRQIMNDYVNNERAFSPDREEEEALAVPTKALRNNPTTHDCKVFKATLNRLMLRFEEAFFLGQSFPSEKTAAPFFAKIEDALSAWSPLKDSIQKLFRLRFELFAFWHVIKFLRTKKNHVDHPSFLRELKGSLESEGAATTRGLEATQKAYFELISNFITLAQYLQAMRVFQKQLLLESSVDPFFAKRLPIAGRIAIWQQKEVLLQKYLTFEEKGLDRSLLITFKTNYHLLVKSFLEVVRGGCSFLLAELYEDMEEALVAFSRHKKETVLAFINQQTHLGRKAEKWRCLFIQYDELKETAPEETAFDKSIPLVGFGTKLHALLKEMAAELTTTPYVNISRLKQLDSVKRGLDIIESSLDEEARSRQASLLAKLEVCEKKVKDPYRTKWIEEIRSLKEASVGLLTDALADTAWAQMQEVISQLYMFLEEPVFVLLGKENSDLQKEAQELLYLLLERMQMTVLVKWEEGPLTQASLSSMNTCFSFYEKVVTGWHVQKDNNEFFDAFDVTYERRFQERLTKIRELLKETFADLPEYIEAEGIKERNIEEETVFQKKLSLCEEAHAYFSQWGASYGETAEYKDMQGYLQGLSCIVILNKYGSEILANSGSNEITAEHFARYLTIAGEEWASCDWSVFDASLMGSIKRAFDFYGIHIQQAFYKYVRVVLPCLGLYRIDDRALSTADLLLKSLQRIEGRIEPLFAMCDSAEKSKYLRHLNRVWQGWERFLSVSLRKDFDFPEIVTDVFKRVQKRMQKVYFSASNTIYSLSEDT